MFLLVFILISQCSLNVFAVDRDINEESYEEALDLIANGNPYDGLSILLELGDYKDSCDRSESMLQQYGGFFGIAVSYDEGDGVEQDYAKALEWYEKAEEAGDIRAMTNLGWLYEYGNGVEQDYAKALDWYRKAAEAGDARAMTSLGRLYEYGNGVEQDYAKALEWYEKGAEEGNAVSMLSLGWLYEKGNSDIWRKSRST